MEIELSKILAEEVAKRDEERRLRESSEKYENLIDKSVASSLDHNSLEEATLGSYHKLAAAGNMLIGDDASAQEHVEKALDIEKIGLDNKHHADFNSGMLSDAALSLATAGTGSVVSAIAKKAATKAIEKSMISEATVSAAEKVASIPSKAFGMKTGSEAIAQTVKTGNTKSINKFAKNISDDFASGMVYTVAQTDAENMANIDKDGNVDGVKFGEQIFLENLLGTAFAGAVRVGKGSYGFIKNAREGKKLIEDAKAENKNVLMGVDTNAVKDINSPDIVQSFKDADVDFEVDADGFINIKDKEQFDNIKELIKNKKTPVVVRHGDEFAMSSKPTGYVEGDAVFNPKTDGVAGLYADPNKSNINTNMSHQTIPGTSRSLFLKNTKTREEIKRANYAAKEYVKTNKIVDEANEINEKMFHNIKDVADVEVTPVRNNKTGEIVYGVKDFKTKDGKVIDAADNTKLGKVSDLLQNVYLKDPTFTPKNYTSATDWIIDGIVNKKFDNEEAIKELYPHTYEKAKSLENIKGTHIYNSEVARFSEMTDKLYNTRVNLEKTIAKKAEEGDYKGKLEAEKKLEAINKIVDENGRLSSTIKDKYSANVLKKTANILSKHNKKVVNEAELKDINSGIAEGALKEALHDEMIAKGLDQGTAEKYAKDLSSEFSGTFDRGQEYLTVNKDPLTNEMTVKLKDEFASDINEVTEQDMLNIGKVSKEIVEIDNTYLATEEVKPDTTFLEAIKAANNDYTYKSTLKALDIESNTAFVASRETMEILNSTIENGNVKVINVGENQYAINLDLLSVITDEDEFSDFIKSMKDGTLNENYVRKISDQLESAEMELAELNELYAIYKDEIFTTGVKFKAELISNGRIQYKAAANPKNSKIFRDVFKPKDLAKKSIKEELNLNDVEYTSFQAHILDYYGRLPKDFKFKSKEDWEKFVNNEFERFFAEVVFDTAKGLNNNVNVYTVFRKHAKEFVGSNAFNAYKELYENAVNVEEIIDILKDAKFGLKKDDILLANDAMSSGLSIKAAAVGLFDNTFGFMKKEANEDLETLAVDVYQKFADAAKKVLVDEFNADVAGKFFNRSTAKKPMTATSYGQRIDMSGVSFADGIVSNIIETPDKQEAYKLLMSSNTIREKYTAIVNDARFSKVSEFLDSSDNKKWFEEEGRKGSNKYLLDEEKLKIKSKLRDKLSKKGKSEAEVEDAFKAVVLKIENDRKDFISKLKDIKSDKLKGIDIDPFDFVAAVKNIEKGIEITDIQKDTLVKAMSVGMKHKIETQIKEVLGEDILTLMKQEDASTENLKIAFAAKRAKKDITIERVVGSMTDESINKNTILYEIAGDIIGNDLEKYKTYQAYMFEYLNKTQKDGKVSIKNVENSIPDDIFDTKKLMNVEEYVNSFPKITNALGDVYSPISFNGNVGYSKDLKLGRVGPTVQGKIGPANTQSMDAAIAREVVIETNAPVLNVYDDFMSSDPESAVIANKKMAEILYTGVAHQNAFDVYEFAKNISDLTGNEIVDAAEAIVLEEMRKSGMHDKRLYKNLLDKNIKLLKNGKFKKEAKKVLDDPKYDNETGYMKHPITGKKGDGIRSLANKEKAKKINMIQKHKETIENGGEIVINNVSVSRYDDVSSFKPDIDFLKEMEMKIKNAEIRSSGNNPSKNVEIVKEKYKKVVASEQTGQNKIMTASDKSSVNMAESNLVVQFDKDVSSSKFVEDANLVIIKADIENMLNDGFDTTKALEDINHEATHYAINAAARYRNIESTKDFAEILLNEIFENSRNGDKLKIDGVVVNKAKQGKEEELMTIIMSKLLQNEQVIKNKEAVAFYKSGKDGDIVDVSDLISPIEIVNKKDKTDTTYVINTADDLVSYLETRGDLDEHSIKKVKADIALIKNNYDSVIVSESVQAFFKRDLEAIKAVDAEITNTSLQIFDEVGILDNIKNYAEKKLNASQSVSNISSDLSASTVSYYFDMSSSRAAVEKMQALGKKTDEEAISFAAVAKDTADNIIQKISGVQNADKSIGLLMSKGLANMFKYFKDDFVLGMGTNDIKEIARKKLNNIRDEKILKIAGNETNLKAYTSLINKNPSSFNDIKRMVIAAEKSTTKSLTAEEIDTISRYIHDEIAYKMLFKGKKSLMDRQGSELIQILNSDKNINLVNEVINIFNEQKTNNQLFGANPKILTAENEFKFVATTKKPSNKSDVFGEFVDGNKKYYIKKVKKDRVAILGQQKSELIDLDISDMASGFVALKLKDGRTKNISTSYLKLSEGVADTAVSVQIQRNAYKKKYHEIARSTQAKQISLIKKNGIAISKAEFERLSDSKKREYKIISTGPAAQNGIMYVKTKFSHKVAGTAGYNIKELAIQNITSDKYANLVNDAVLAFVDISNIAKNMILISRPAGFINSFLSSVGTGSVGVGAKNSLSFFKNLSSIKDDLSEYAETKRKINELEVKGKKGTDEHIELENKLKNSVLHNAIDNGLVAATIRSDTYKTNAYASNKLVKNTKKFYVDSGNLVDTITLQPNTYLGNILGNAYDMTENLPKLAMYKTLVDSGVAPDIAVERTRAAFPTYGNMPEPLAAFEELPIVLDPFWKYALSWPRMMHTAMTNTPTMFSAAEIAFMFGPRLTWDDDEELTRKEIWYKENGYMNLFNEYAIYMPSKTNFASPFASPTMDWKSWDVSDIPTISMIETLIDPEKHFKVATKL